MDLYLNSGSDYSIQDQRGTLYTPAEARALWEAGSVKNTNIAFERLVHLNFDVAAVKAFYRNGGRA